MKQIPAIICFSLIVALGFTTPGSGQDKAAGKPLVVSVGEVTKIDLKKKVMTVRSAFVQTSSPSTNTQGGGRRGGGGGRVSGGGGNRGQGGGGAGGIGRTSGTPEYKVYCTAETALKEADQTITLEDFKVGDGVSVTGTFKGRTDIEATEIVRTPSSRPLP